MGSLPLQRRGSRFIAFENDGGAVTHVLLRDRGPQPLGDLNGDGIVDEKDREILRFNWCTDSGCCECCAADLNGDGMVNQDYLDILNANIGGGLPCQWMIEGGS